MSQGLMFRPVNAGSVLPWDLPLPLSLESKYACPLLQVIRKAIYLCKLSGAFYFLNSCINNSGYMESLCVILPDFIWKGFTNHWPGRVAWDLEGGGLTPRRAAFQALFCYIPPWGIQQIEQQQNQKPKTNLSV